MLLSLVLLHSELNVQLVLYFQATLLALPKFRSNVPLQISDHISVQCRSSSHKKFKRKKCVTSTRRKSEHCLGTFKTGGTVSWPHSTFLGFSLSFMLPKKTLLNHSCDFVLALILTGTVNVRDCLMAKFAESCGNDKEEMAKHRVMRHDNNIVRRSLVPVALWSCHHRHVSITRDRAQQYLHD
jgi:hypothetical protein